MKYRNEFVVGLVVLAGLVVLVVGTIWLSGRPWATPQRELRAIFRDVGQLRAGNDVLYRGVPVGRVRRIELVPGGAGVLVDMEVRPDLVLTPDAAVVLAPASLFGDWQAILTSERTYPDLAFARSTDPGVLPGATLPDMSQLTQVAARIAGDIETLTERVEIAFTEETALDIRRTVQNVQDMSERLNGFVAVQTRNLDVMARHAIAASQNIERATARVERVAGEVEASMRSGVLQEVLANVQRASANLERLSNQLQNATTGVPTVVAQADSTLRSLNAVLKQIQPQLGPTLLEVRVAMSSLQKVASQLQQGQGTLGRLIDDPALYEELQRAVASLRRLLADIQQNPGRYVGQLKVF